ncbi:MAG: hypothetical protein M1830_001482 [Pleopsidium flavum]|nr:MAG: hypothetical protein M1830_002122 [Pleopsidium flavum]KAI9872557.1 MAG: hypothetical protein M1830_001482 [Pleopsidium flavum]
MASLPPQSTSPQRRRSIPLEQPTPTPASDDPQLQTGRRPSTTSEDSQTVFLNTPPPLNYPQREKQISSQAPAPSEDDEPRKCWICFTDETEDTPSSSVWRSPCPCALVAHESCLLDWVADLESPNSRKRTTSPKILCPQCKSEIVIARPRSLIVEGVNAIERITERLVVPGLFVTLAGTIYTGCFFHGLITIYAVFGIEDAQRIMDHAHNNMPLKTLIWVPGIPLMLVLARTKMADNILPVMPIIFLASQTAERQRMDVNLWPPSAAMTVAALPYIRGAYNEIYERLFGERERRWLKEVQPRAGENDNENAAGPGEQAGNNGQGGEQEEVMMELNLEVEVFEEEAEGGNEQQPQPQDQAGAAEVPAAQGGAAQNQQQAPNLQPLGQRQNNLIISTSQLADTILGALLFPSVSAVMGAILKAALPHSWTTPSVPFYRGRSGLLQTRWGRTIIGGCLFVVLKDTVVLYSRWKLAQTHRKRRILDYDRSKGKVVDR